MAGKRKISSVCVYCGSSQGNRPVFNEAAKCLGRELAGRGWDIIYGGSHRGLMGSLADAALSAGGRVIGVIPQSLVDLEIAHRGLSELHIVKSMHERKAEMTRMADAFLILPGAWGTLDELCEALTWAQLGIHHKPCGLWNVDGYYDLFLAFVEQAVERGFLKAHDRTLLLVGNELPDLLEQLEQYEPETRAVPAKIQ